MSESKHTPGPWTLGKGSMAIREENGEHRFIARVHMPGELRPFDEGVQRANARLIAQSPEMHALLRELVAAANGPHVVGGTLKSYMVNEMLIRRAQNILDAIAKAEGKP